MRQEHIDIAKSAAATWVPWAAVDFFTSMNMAQWLALIAFILQTLYLLRKWWREETEWGIKLKKWAKKVTRPAPLEDEA